MKRVAAIASQHRVGVVVFHLLGSVSQLFDRERIPARVVLARGAGAHGYFEAYGKIGDS